MPASRTPDKLSPVKARMEASILRTSCARQVGEMHSPAYTSTGQVWLCSELQLEELVGEDAQIGAKTKFYYEQRV